MPKVLGPVQFVMIALAGWMTQRQLQTIEYLREENRVLREQLGDRRVRFNDDQRRRLAAKAKGLGLPTFCQQKNRETSGDKGWRKGLRPTLNALRSRDSQPRSPCSCLRVAPRRLAVAIARV